MLLFRKYSKHKAYDSFLRSSLIEKESKWAILFGIIGDDESELGIYLTRHLKICLSCVNRFRCKVLNCNFNTFEMIT